MRNPFTDHPSSVGETYTQHLTFAWGTSWLLIQLALAAWIHGVFPWLYPCTVSRCICKLAAEFECRNSETAPDPKHD